MTNLPTILTWARVLAIPLLVILFRLPLPATFQNICAAAITMLAAFTDWLDGWLARRWGQTSAFGAFLDPVADKLMVCVALILLVGLHRLDVVVAVIIVGRELTISALREWMAFIGERASVAVHAVGKVKTIAQLISIPLLMLDQVGPFSVRHWGTWLIWGAAILTVWSMCYYLKCAWPYLMRRDQ